MFDPSEWQQPFDIAKDKCGSFIPPEGPPTRDEIGRFANRRHAQEYAGSQRSKCEKP